MLQCIALDGTCYQKAGLISGGSLDLAKRAKRWNDKEMAQLEARKVCEKMKEIARTKGPRVFFSYKLLS